MKLTGLHILLTYQCTFECDHCFVFGSPWQSGTLTLAQIRDILSQAKACGTVDWIYYEGGEPTLFYPILVKSVVAARQMGFQVGIVSNAHWATSLEDAAEWLRPFTGLVNDFSISSDLFHYSEAYSQQARFASAAAEDLDIPLGVISIAQPEANAVASVGQLPSGEGQVMYRGRAVEKLAHLAPHHPWESFTECPYEDLHDPGRVHLDPLGYLHVCQGICIGNLFEKPLIELWERFNPREHPIIGALLDGGPAELVRRFDLPHEEQYADACHLCFTARQALRTKYPHILAPDQVYGIFAG